MAEESSRDLPLELLEKLRDLELELEDGDITQKGFEKKKAGLFERFGVSITANDSSSMAGHEVDLGPEPSAADVIDFLDYLPSPTHSPTRPTQGAHYMEENHRQHQDRLQDRPPPEQPYVNYPRSHTSPTQSYKSSPSLSTMQGVPPSSSSSSGPYGQSMRSGDSSMGYPPPPLPLLQTQPSFSSAYSQQPHPQQGPYYASLPNRPYDPRMNRPPYSQNAGSSSPMRHPTAPYGYPSPQRPPSNPPMNAYRPPSGSPNTAYPQRPMYNSPRPMHRPPAMNRPSSTYYRPPGQANPNGLIYADHRTENPSPHGNYRPPYGYNQRPPATTHTRHNSDHTAESVETSSRQSHGRNDSLVGRDTPHGNETRRAPSIMSVSNRSTCTSRWSHQQRLWDPYLLLLSRSNQLSTSRGRYGNSAMASSFKTIEPFPSPIIHLEDPAEYSLLADVAGCQSLPLIPRLLPAYQQHSPLQNYCSLAQVLRYQVSHNSLSRTTPALTLVDNRGKETSSIHWEKLLARAEKVAKVIQEKSSVQPGECIALMYRKSEAIEFTVALLGCFLAGRVAVPVNASTELVELVFVLTVSSSRLVLTTDQNLKAFTKDMQARQVEFPKNIEWWKTNDFGSWYPSQKTAESPDIKVSELAYIEYVKAANGELKGVAMTHKALMAQCRVYQTAVTETIPNPNLTSQHYDQGESFVPSSPLLPVVDCVVTYLEPRQQVGLILSIFCSVFAGNHTIFANVSIMETPAVWIYVLSKYKATIALADYVGLKLAVEQYQANPKEVYTHSKKVAPDLSSLRFLMVDTTIVDPELNEVIAESLLRPLGVKNNPLQIVCPLLSLPEYGGMIVSFRDYLGAALLEEFVADDGPENEEVDGDHPKPPVFRARSALASGHSRDVWECVLDASALRNNKVVVLAAGSGSQIAEHMNEPGAVRMGSFGFVLPQATVAIVDPETTALCAPDTIGEVWIDAPSVPGGFWGLPGHTDAIFHARPIVVSSESCSLEAYHQEFLRTGLIGKMIGGRLVVFGTYEDRIRQQRLGEGTGCNETHFSNNLVETIRRNSSIEACVFFDIMVNSQLLPVLVFESSASREELANLVSNVMEIILAFHGLRLYAAIAVAPRTLPRAIKHNRRQVHALMAKRAFLFGQLSPRFVKMDVDRTIFSVATSLDLYQDIWRSSLAYEKAISMNIVSTRPHPQHTGMEAVQIVLDERTDCDLSKFANIVDLFLWRASLHPDETAFIGLTQATGPLVTKSYTWRKISTKIAAIASHLRKKVKLARHDKILLLIPFGLDFIITLYACLTLGVVVVPCPPPDPEQHPQRIGEDVTNMFAVLSDLNISAILTNGKGEDIMKSKHVSPVLKQAMSVRKSNFKMPEQHSVNKAAKFNKMLGKESGLIIPSEWAMDTSPVLISVQYSVDMRRIYTTLGHNTILAQCRTQKMTCQMKFQRSLVAAGIHGTQGLGLLHSTFCGIYVGCPTVLLSDEDFYTNPIAYFELVQRYKAKDACISHPLLQYVMNRANQADLRRIVLHNVQNLMITTEDRAKPTLYQHMVKYFSPCRLEKEAISTVYSHIANPMITTRSYMLVEPISLFVDASWLRQGIVRPTPAEDGQSMLLHDSGIVPSNTMVAIINPETNMLCPDNIIGEIWVSSDCNIQSYYGMDEANHCARFEATIAGSDPRIKYMRTGDLGFLWNVQRQINGRNMVEEGQCLFVLGPMSETIKVNRLLYFPADIEHSVERCHPTIPPGGCHVFQTNSEVVAVVAVKSKEHALAIVPLVVNAVLENHTFLVDTIVVVSSQQLPRSRYGDKLRGKTLASFVEQKLKTALYVSRITNQHQPLMLPQWHQSQGVYDDNMSITSGYAPQMGGPYTSYENNDSVDRQSIDQLRRVDTARSYRTQSSTGADSIPATIM